MNKKITIGFFAFLCGIILLAGILHLSPVGAAAADSSVAAFGYTTREHTLKGVAVGGQTSIGYRAYIPKQKKNNAIVILVSGWTCGPAWLHYAAVCLAEQHGIETWTVKRRMSFYENRAAFLADLKILADANAATDKCRQALERLQNPANYCNGKDIRALDAIGYDVLLDDIDGIVCAAANKKQPVILGGWSDGVEYVMAYAQREYTDGKRGHERLRGLLFIDENPEWGTYTTHAMRQKLNEKQAAAASSVYERRAPGVTIFEALGALTALRMGLPMRGAKQDLAAADALAARISLPRAARTESPFAQLFPRRPRPQMTDAALMGWLYDGAGMGTSAWSWLVTAGSLDTAQTPADWRDGGHTPLSRLAAIHTLPEGVWEWFYPHRIAIDYWDLGLTGFNNERLRISLDRSNRLPVFAVVSGFNRHTGAGLPAGLDWWRQRTGIPEDRFTLLKLHHFKHTDILLSPAAEKELWSPIADWVKLVVSF